MDKIVHQKWFLFSLCNLITITVTAQHHSLNARLNAFSLRVLVEYYFFLEIIPTRSQLQQIGNQGFNCLTIQYINPIKVLHVVTSYGFLSKTLVLVNSKLIDCTILLFCYLQVCKHLLMVNGNVSSHIHTHYNIYKTKFKYIKLPVSLLFNCNYF